MAFIDSLDYLNLNSLRRYPLREGSSVTSLDGNFVLPDSLIVDCQLATGGAVQERYYISKFFNKLSAFTVEVSAHLSGAVVGSFNVDVTAHVENAEYYMAETVDFTGANGKIVIGSVADLRTQPSGEFAFNIAATEFEARVSPPSLKGIPRIKFTDDVAGVKVVTGTVVVAARSNLRFTYDDPEGYVVLDAGDNLGLNKQCANDKCIKTIDGVGPNASGNINLIGLNCLSVANTAANTLYFSDTCCTPCSGCEDLADLTSRLISLENNFLTLKIYYNSLNAQLTTYLSTTNANCSCD